MYQTAVPLKEKLSYGLAQAAVGVVITMAGTYLLYFYTDVYGLSAAAVGSLFLVSRLCDGVIDVGIGAIIDRTRSRWGHCRPYLLWCALPLALLTVMTFSVPQFGATGKLIYAWVTFNLLTLLLTGINLPLGAIVPSMTSDRAGRLEVSSIGAFFAIIGLVVANYATLPLVKLIGAHDQAAGFRGTVMIYATLALIFCWIAFWNIRERVPPASMRKNSLGESWAAIKGNRPWMITAIVIIAFWIAVIAHNLSTIYYLKHIFGRPEWTPEVMATMVAALPSTLAASVVAKRIGKRNTMTGGAFIAAFGLLTISAGGSTSLALLLAGNLIFAFGKGVIIGLFVAMLSDTVDYGEWQSGVRAPGVLFAGSSLGVKIGMGLGSASCAWFLSLGHYVPGALQQLPSAKFAIAIAYIWMPLAALGVVVVALAFYRLDTQYQLIRSDLLQRAKSGSPT